MIEQFLKFIHQSPTPYHVICNISSRLNEIGFSEIDPKKCEWLSKVKPGFKGYIKLNGSSILAFMIPFKFHKESGFTIIASHSDSPCLKVKPNFSVNRFEYNMIGVQMYGGGIWHSWFDRELSLAGLVMIKDDINVKSVLINFDKPLFVIPNLAIHFDRKIHDQFSPDLQSHLLPLFDVENSKSGSSNILMDLICKEINVTRENIVDFDLSLVDYQKPALGGYNNQLLFSARLDNLFNTFTSLMGFINSISGDNVNNENNIRVFLCCDNEEVGSKSYQGADTNQIEYILNKLVTQLNGDFYCSISNSFILSADQAHAFHPNYSDKYDDNHQIKLGDSLVLKYNANQRYATTSFTSSIIKIIAQRHNIAISSFVIKNSLSCGSTIGPILSSNLGIKTADVGFPMLSMHSIRETCASSSVMSAILFYGAFYEELSCILKNSCENPE